MTTEHDRPRAASQRQFIQTLHQIVEISQLFYLRTHAVLLLRPRSCLY